MIKLNGGRLDLTSVLSEKKGGILKKNSAKKLK
jgi:hypothetical protein